MFFFCFFGIWYRTLNIMKIILRFVHISCTYNRVNVNRTMKVCEILWVGFLYLFSDSYNFDYILPVECVNMQFDNGLHFDALLTNFDLL